MTVMKKALATVEAVESENPNGEFDIILSAQTRDRDGDVLRSDEWKLPLPDHIVMDVDHGMDVASTVGSGRPFVNEAGDLQVRGTFASTAEGQRMRTLVTEGHIRTTSVAFITEKSTEKDAKPVRELLNGAFVAIPSNREAVVLSAKSLDVLAKAGARNNAGDTHMIQAIHDAAYHLGAACDYDADEDDGGSDSAEEQARTSRRAVDPALLETKSSSAVDAADSAEKSAEAAADSADELRAKRLALEIAMIQNL